MAGFRQPKVWKEIRMCITNDILDVIFPFQMTSVILGKSGGCSGNCTQEWSTSALLEQIES